MNNLMVFEGKEVEIFEFDGKILFNPKHVAECLEISDVNSSIRKFNDNQVVKLTNSDMHNMHIRKLNNAGEKFLTESGVYKLIFKSRKEEAERFQDWVTDEVLPTIRKNGGYLTDSKIEEILSNPDTIIKLATDLKEERTKRKILEETNNKQQQIIGELKPKADYTDLILRNKGLVTITQIAKDYGMSGKAMNKRLNELGIQFKQSGQWLLYSDYQAKGYTHSETIDIVRADGTSDIKMNTKWTQKGRLMIYKKLKSIGILPVIEFSEVC
ncbi:anti-repressor [Clostridioides difficile]|nr:anti-repressor [Clostridioides difficile]